MSRRRALLTISRPKVTLTRTSSTTYLVESTTASASLKFKRLSDGYVENIGNVTLPYTFMHVEGEIWSVSSNNGINYKEANYKLEILTDGSNFKVRDSSILQIFNDFKVDFKFIQDMTPSSWVIYRNTPLGSLGISTLSAVPTRVRYYDGLGGNVWTNMYLRVSQGEDYLQGEANINGGISYSSRSYQYDTSTLPPIDTDANTRFFLNVRVEVYKLVIEGEVFHFEGGNVLVGENGNIIDIIGVDSVDFNWK